MKIKLHGFKRLLVESALIVFSVLFALFINRYAENQKVQQQKEIALERIVEEMKDNRRIIDSAAQIHQVALNNLQRAVADERDTLRMYLIDQGCFDPDAFGLLLNNASFFPEFPKSTSWDAAATTGIIAEFDYRVVTAITEAYTIQKFITGELVPSITDIVFAPVDEEELKTIKALSVQIRELINVEQTTVAYIDKALEVIYPPDTSEGED